MKAKIQIAVVGAVVAVTCLAAEPDVGEVRKIHVGSNAFHSVDFTPYEAQYTSRSSVTGAFTLKARMIDEGKAISLIDIIPTPDNVIVAQRRLHSASHALEFSAGPLFSWGAEFVIQQMGSGTYDWSRIPIGGGAPIRSAGQLPAGVTSDLFSPTLGSLMPQTVGEEFALPVAVPRTDGSVSVWWEVYKVVAKERLDTPSGESCECWLIEKSAPGGGTTVLWVDAKPPFVFKRVFDRGGDREFVSDLLAFEAAE